MGREEQQEEREVLDSIFPEEITDVSESEFKVIITLDIPEDDEEGATEQPSFVLAVRYPEDYPDQPPHLELQSAPDAPSHPNFNLSTDRDQLLSSLDETIQENLGIAMVFTLVTTLKDNAEQLIQERKDTDAKAHEEIMLAAEREENKKFQGTAVTPETFLKWREDFLKEMEEERQRAEEERLAELKKAKVKEPVKLTGRQLWERGLAGKGDEDDEEGLPTEGVENLKVEA